jgi:hypothetical protein
MAQPSTAGRAVLMGSDHMQRPNKFRKLIREIRRILKELRGLAEDATITFAVGYGLYLFISKVLMG